VFGVLRPFHFGSHRCSSALTPDPNATLQHPSALQGGATAVPVVAPSFTATSANALRRPTHARDDSRGTMSEKMSVDKHDPTKDDSEESMESSPEGEAPPAATAQENQQPKRKGGRKPVCSCKSRAHHPLHTYTLVAPQQGLTEATDLRDIGGKKTAEPTGSGSVQRTTY